MTVRVVPLLQALLLLTIGLAASWGLTGWMVALLAAVVLDVLVMLGMRHYRADTLGAADFVTIARATLTCAVAALVVASLAAGALLDTSPWTTTITVLAAVSLLFDLVDGWVARWTGTETPFGARFDGEADAALMLVLCVWIAPALGWWVLAIGLARYAFGVAGWLLPWMRAELPARYWRKVVTAVTSIILVVGTAGVVAPPLMVAGLLVGLALIAESFGRDVWWLSCHRAQIEDVPQDARRAAYGPGEFVDQQGFMTASEIRELAVAADIGPNTRVLDLCCGTGGPGRLIARESGCDLLGIDASASAVAAARAHAGDLTCHYEVGRIPPVPAGPFDVVLLFETMLAFRDKNALLRDVRAALAPAGRFAFTLEEGQPLTEHERAAMPAADTVWPIPLDRLHELLGRTGFAVTWQQDRTDAHRDVVDSLLTEFTTHESAIAAQIGSDELESLLTSRRLERVAEQGEDPQVRDRRSCSARPSRFGRGRPRTSGRRAAVGQPVTQQHHVTDRARLNQARGGVPSPWEVPVVDEPPCTRVPDEEGRHHQVHLVGQPLGEELRQHRAPALDEQALDAPLGQVGAHPRHGHRMPAVDHRRRRPEPCPRVVDPVVSAVDELVGVAAGEEVRARVEVGPLAHGHLDRGRGAPRRDPLVHALLAAHEQPRVVLAQGAGAHEDRVAVRAHLVDPVEVGLVGEHQPLRGGVVEVAVEGDGAAEDRVRTHHGRDTSSSAPGRVATSAITP